MYLFSRLVLASVTVPLSLVSSSFAAFQLDRRTGEASGAVITATTTVSEALTLPLKDQSTSTTPSTSILTKEQTTTSIPLKDQTSATTLPAKDELTTSEDFLFPTVPAKDQSTTPSKNQTSATTLPTSDVSTTSQKFLSPTVPAKDQTTTASVSPMDKKSTPAVSSKVEPTALPQSSSTTIPTKDQNVSFTTVTRDKTSTSALPVKIETMTTPVTSSSAPMEDEATSTSLPLKDQTSTSMPPAKAETTVTSDFPSTTSPDKDHFTSSFTHLKGQTSASTTPSQVTLLISPLITSSTTMPAKDQTRSPTVTLKDQTSSSSVTSNEATATLLITTALSQTYSITSTSTTLKDKTETTSSAAKDEIVTPSTNKAPPFKNITASASMPLTLERTVSSLPAKDMTTTFSAPMTSTTIPAEDMSSSQAVLTEDLKTVTSALPTKDEPTMTVSHASSILIYQNSTTTVPILTEGLYTYSATLLTITTSTDSFKSIDLPTKGENNTLSSFYGLSTVQSSIDTTTLGSQKDETLTVISSKLPATYFPGLVVSPNTSSPENELLTSATSMPTTSPAPAPVISTGVSSTLPIVSTILIPVDYTLGLLPVPSTSPNVTDTSPKNPPPALFSASAVSTPGFWSLSSPTSSTEEKLPATSAISPTSLPIPIPSGLGSLPSTSTITPIIVLTVTKLSVASTIATHSPILMFNTTSIHPTLAPMSGTSNSIATSIMMLSLLGQIPPSPSTSTSTPSSVSVPSSPLTTNTSILYPVGPSLSTLSAFNPTMTASSALSFKFITPPALSFPMTSTSSSPTVSAPTKSEAEPSMMTLAATGTPISFSNGSSIMIPLYTPDMLGNAYGGGYITTPSIYIVVSSTPTIGVPPGYGYSFSTEGSTIISSFPASSTLSSSPGENSTFPEAPKDTQSSVPGIAQSPGTAASGNGSFLVPIQPSTTTTFQGSASKCGVVLLTLPLGMLIGILIH